MIQAGDRLFGGTVVFVDLYTEALNDAGQLAFYFELDDGTRGIARADPAIMRPVPQASTNMLLSIGLAGLGILVRRNRSRSCLSTTAA